MSETSTKPYMIRALHEWCTDNGYTPHIVVQVDSRSRVPRAYVQDEQITLNIALLATHKLDLGNEYIEFQARFGGKTEQISVPVSAITAIYARETGAGMGFEVEESTIPDDDLDNDISSSDTAPSADEADDKPKRPHLTVVK